MFDFLDLNFEKFEVDFNKSKYFCDKYLNFQNKI